MSGFFISFEGGEGAGKSTLLHRVYEELSSRLSVIKTRAPGGTPLGLEIRHLLLEEREHPPSPLAELFLFLADRAQHIDEVISPSLQRGQIVLCDRFSDSTIAYQGFARGWGQKRITDLCLFATKEIKPHLTFYLDLDPKIGFERVKKTREKDRMEEEELSFHIKIREAFLILAKEEPNRFCVLDATQASEEVFSKAIQVIEERLETR